MKTAAAAEDRKPMSEEEESKYLNYVIPGWKIGQIHSKKRFLNDIKIYSFKLPLIQANYLSSISIASLSLCTFRSRLLSNCLKYFKNLNLIWYKFPFNSDTKWNKLFFAHLYLALKDRDKIKKHINLQIFNIYKKRFLSNLHFKNSYYLISLISTYCKETFRTQVDEIGFQQFAKYFFIASERRKFQQNKIELGAWYKISSDLCNFCTSDSVKCKIYS